MVLIGLQEALLTYQEDRAFSALIKLLFEPNKNIHVPSRLSKTEDVVIALLASVSNKDKQLFEKAMSVLERRKVSEETEWIHNDLAVFSMIVSNLFYGGHAEVIKKGLQGRLNSSDRQSLEITKSLYALNDGTDAVTASVQSIIVVGHELLGSAGTLDKEVLRNALKQNEQLELDENAPPFLRLLGQKTMSIAVAMCAFDSFSEHYAMKKLVNGFDGRAQIFSYFSFLTIFLSFTGVWLLLVWLYFLGNEGLSSQIEKIFGIGAAIAPISILYKKKAILRYSRSLFYHIFGGRDWLKYENKNNLRNTVAKSID